VRPVSWHATCAMPHVTCENRLLHVPVAFHCTVLSLYTRSDWLLAGGCAVARGDEMGSGILC
jgi:hypothetical protein